MIALLTVAQEAEPDPARLVIPTEIDEIIFGFVAFLAVFLVLRRLVWPRLLAVLQAREDAIRGELERAEQARLEAERQREEYERRLADARSEADRVVREATEAAEAVRRERIAKAEEEARQIIDKARQDAGQEKQRAFAELQRAMADISIEAATRVLGRELSDPESQRQLVEQFITEAGMRGNGGRS